jgi:hypothetical protein
MWLKKIGVRREVSTISVTKLGDFCQKRSHDTRHNDTQHNDIQHNDIQHNDTQQNDTQHNDTHLYNK